MGKNGKAKKQNGIPKSITKVMDGARTLPSTPVSMPQTVASRRRACVKKLAQLESLDQSSANVPPPAP
jgi:hypothetical protein